MKANMMVTSFMYSGMGKWNKACNMPFYDTIIVDILVKKLCEQYALLTFYLNLSNHEKLI